MNKPYTQTNVKKPKVATRLHNGRTAEHPNGHEPEYRQKRDGQFVVTRRAPRTDEAVGSFKRSGRLFSEYTVVCPAAGNGTSAQAYEKARQTERIRRAV